MAGELDYLLSSLHEVCPPSQYHDKLSLSEDELYEPVQIKRSEKAASESSVEIAPHSYPLSQNQLPILFSSSFKFVIITS